MAACDLPLVLEAVGHLDRELTRLARQATALVGPRSSADRGATITDLRTSVERSHRAIRALRDRVLDSASALTTTRFEAAFRARAIVLQLQFHELDQGESEIVQPLWPVGRFQSLVDVSSYVLDRIGRVNAAWLEDRRGPGTGDDALDHRALIAAVARAERELLAIGRDADLIVFLAVGASMRPARFRLACRVIAALLDVPLAPMAPRVVRGEPSLVRRHAPRVAVFAPPAPSEEDD